MGKWWNGRHAGLRNQCLLACGFESRLPYFIKITMELRNVTLTLQKAKEFYNSGNDALKEVALQAFTKEELTIPKYTDIKTLEDAVKALGMDMDNVLCDISYMEDIEGKLGKHLIAIYKLDIIRKALNGNWKPSLVQGSVYYPYVRFYPAGQKAREAASSKSWKLGESFIADGKKYTLDGLAGFGFGYGEVRPTLGLLGCKSREIADHMSRYFSKEIFEATYSHHAGTYQWV